MKRRWFWLTGLVLSSSLILPGVASAQQQPAGVVTGIQGQAQLTRPAVAPAPLRFKDGVIIRDVVDTREKSLARILFGGRSTVTVRELSRLQVTEEILPTGARRDVHDLSSGAILVNVARQLMRPGDEVQIRTPNAVAAVRGSIVFAQYIAGVSFFAFLTGEGLVTALGGVPIPVGPNRALPITTDPATGAARAGAVRDVPQAEANRIIQESKVGGRATAEDAQTQTQTASQLADTVVAAVTLTPTTPTPATTTIDTVTKAPVTAGGTGILPTTGSTVLKGSASALPPVTLSGTQTLSSPALSANLLVTQPAGTGNQVQVASGANITTSTTLADFTNSTFRTSGNLLDVLGSLTNSSTSPLVNIDPSTVTTGGDLVSLGSGASLTTSGALLKTTNGATSSPSVITNPGFESSLSGWTVVNQSGSSGNFFSQSGTTSPTSGFTVPAPPGGSFTAMSDQSSPGSHVIFQDVTVPTGSPVLRFDLFVGNRATEFANPGTLTLPNFTVQSPGSPDANQQARVDILSTSAATFDVSVLQNLFQTQAGDTLVEGFIPFAADLSAFAGQTVRIRFAEVDNENLFQLGIDNVSFANEIIVGGAALKLTGGASLSAGGSLLDLAGTNLNVTGAILDASGLSTVTNTAGPVIKATNSTITADSLLKSDESGNTFNFTGTLLDLTNSTLTVRVTGDSPTTGPDLDDFNLSVAANEPLIRMNNSTLTATETSATLSENILGIEGADFAGGTFPGVAIIATNNSIITNSGDGLFSMEGVLTTTTTQPLVQITGSTVTTKLAPMFAVEVFGTAPTTITMAGSLLSATNSSLTSEGGDFVEVSGNLISSTTQALIQLTNSPVTTFNDGCILVVHSSGSTVTIAGPVLNATNSNLSIGLAIVEVEFGKLTSTTATPLITISGGTHTIGATPLVSEFADASALILVHGSTTDLTTGLGNTEHLKTGGKLIEATNGAVINSKKSGATTGGHGLRLDTALLQATAPIISLIGSATATTPDTTLTTAQSTMELIKSKLTSIGPVVALDKGLINVTTGPLINLTSGSNMIVTGDLLSLINGSKINVVNGPLIRVDGTAPSPFTGTLSTLSVSGALVNFGGTGGNQIIVNNSITPITATLTQPGLSGVGISATGTSPTEVASSITIGSNPVRNPTLGSITVTGALIQATGGGQVTICSPSC